MVYAIFISLFIIYLMALVFQFWGIKAFVKILALPRVNLMGIILVVSVVGAFVTNLNFVSIIIMFLSGFVGYFMNRYGYSIVAVTLGVVLGGPIEVNLRSAMNISEGDPSVFVTNPLSL